MTIKTTFGSKLQKRFDEGKRLSIGIDPHDDLLTAWDCEKSAGGAERFGREIVAVAAESALCVKPQIAFFERFGAAGYKALERILADAKQADLLTIADVKRGDIGSTFEAYAKSWLMPGSPLEADAMTVHPYQGFDSLRGAYDFIREAGKGLFVLAATSNPEAELIQQAKITETITVAGKIVEQAKSWNAENLNNSLIGSIGVVLGATLNLKNFSIATSNDQNNLILPILAPGFGHQGAQIEDIKKVFGGLSPGVIVHESRSILKDGIQGLADRIKNHTIRVGKLS